MISPFCLASNKIAWRSITGISLLESEEGFEPHPKPIRATTHRAEKRDRFIGGDSIAQRLFLKNTKPGFGRSAYFTAFCPKPGFGIINTVKLQRINSRVFGYAPSVALRAMEGYYSFIFLFMENKKSRCKPVKRSVVKSGLLARFLDELDLLVAREDDRCRRLTTVQHDCFPSTESDDFLDVRIGENLRDGVALHDLKFLRRRAEAHGHGDQIVDRFGRGSHGLVLSVQ